MDLIEETLKKFLKKFNIDNSGLVYLVAFSGGYDSMSLLYSLNKVSKNKIVAIHLNHNWRGQESLSEEENCRKFCNELNVEFYSETLGDNVPKTETSAREARYDFFYKCAKKFKSWIVFTAHNKNDNVETLIYRICKGTGISGLQGISKQRDIFYRPLLEIERDKIEAYCKNNNLHPNNDSSNSNTKYKRNFIRKEVLPVLSGIDKQVITKINSLSEIAVQENKIIEEYLLKTLDKIKIGNGLSTIKFVKLSDSLKSRLVYKLFIDNDLEYDKKRIDYILSFIDKNKNSKAGKTCSLNSELFLFVNDNIIEVVNSNKQNAIPHFYISKEGKYKDNGFVFELEKFNKQVIKFPKETDNIAYINLKNFDINFEIRPRQEGDYITPFGMNGTQKLKKYLNSKKIPNHKKDELLFLTCDKEILWAINLGISDKIKVDNIPTHVVKFYKESCK